jgi:membrane-associated phospholipid phosphatase
VTAQRTARALTEVGAPAVLLGVLPVVLSLATADTVAVGIAWAVVTAVFFAIAPFTWVLLGVRRGRLTDHHIGRRSQRRGPLLVGLACMVAGWLIALVGHAPATLVAYLGTVLLEAAAAVAVTLVWKISLHSWIAALGATALVIVFGPWALLTIPLVAGVAWSRVRLGDHSPAQVAAGLAAGVLITSVLFPALR